MSLLILQIGQCGNQLGQAFFSYLYQELQSASSAHQALCQAEFFHNGLTANAMLIDMEPKVVNSCLYPATPQNWKYEPKNAFYKQEGSGNNWAFGYNVHGPNCEQAIFEKISNLTEKMEGLKGIIVLQSMAGGTGSGVGSFLVEKLREYYGKIKILSIAVLPHLTGEVILQSYNCVLSLSTIYKESDGMILIENDEIQNICNKLLHLKKASLSDMNQVISRQIASIFFPTIDPNVKSITSIFQKNFDFFEDGYDKLLPNPLFKLLKLHHIPQMSENSKEFNNDAWKALEKRIFQMAISNTSEADTDWNTMIGARNMKKMISNVLLCRGNEVLDHEFSLFENPDLYYRKRVKFECFKDSHNFAKNEKSMTLISNSQCFLNPLDILIERSTQMFQEKAFLYQYEKYKLNSDEFFEHILCAEQILVNYSKI